MKKLAIHLHGHMRTFENTYIDFFKNIVNPNSIKYNIDIFIHTWNELEQSQNNSWHKNLSTEFYPNISGVKLDKEYKNKIKSIYKPVKMIVDKLEVNKHGWFETKKRVCHIRKKYEQEMSIKYDVYLYTRPDLLFLTPLDIDKYISFCNLHFKFDLPQMFLAHSSFSRMPISHPFHLTEGDLLYFATDSELFIPNPQIYYQKISNCLNVGIDYLLYRDFQIWRETSKERYVSFVSIYNKNNLLYNDTFLHKTQLSMKKLSFHSKYGTAKQRIQNQLCYKLGQTMIINSKSIIGILFMPIYLLSTFLNYKQDQKIYHQKIKKDPTLKLPPLENYPDYQEALKYKEHLSYKLGKILLESFKTWHKGGLFKFPFLAKGVKKGMENFN
ncbi:hypothetical protein [Campylobacter jejuni]|uniref:hypothetical protein n=1 Tax=Campylobacter jejuni TaxID=197 RepID=UPI00204498F5|nr:hypothetical protein [Campylobacter jejuni]